MQAVIRAIEYYLPESVLTTAALAAEFPDWSVEKIDKKTGIAERHVAAPGECASDLAYAAAQKLFASGVVTPAEVDGILLCTQSPDYFLPTTACLLQERLGLRTGTLALDYNQGCSGFVYGLGLAKGLIETGQARRLLLLTAETYSKFVNPRDRSVRTIFGDAAAATLIEGVEAAGEPSMGPFVYGTDGSGANNLIVPAGGARHPRTAATAVESEDAAGAWRSADNLYMNGAEVFEFTLRMVPQTVAGLLEQAGKTPVDVDLFVFHQANRYMLNSLRTAMEIPEDKFYLAMRHCGNTVSSTIPIALHHACAEGKLKPGQLAMLVGFGVGYSWAGTLVRWH